MLVDMPMAAKPLLIIQTVLNPIEPVLCSAVDRALVHKREKALDRDVFGRAGMG